MNDTALPTSAAETLEADPHATLPPLSRDVAFWGLNVTQFLGAFNDNLFKQVVLLLFVGVQLGDKPVDLQGLGTLLFSLPFILFSGLSGYLSDRYSKRTLIRSCKVAEIVICLLGLVVFLAYSRQGMNVWMIAALGTVLFLMGTHSTFFGPGKYGILPEMLRKRDLPKANGSMLMSMFLAIIFGMASAGQLVSRFPKQLWVVGLCCAGIAVVGTLSSWLIRRVPASQPGLRLELDSLWIPQDVRQLLRQDRALLFAVMASTVFWASASLVVMSVNSLGKTQLDIGDANTSILQAITSLGIASGSVLAGFLSKGRFNARVLKAGAWGLVLTLVALSLPGSPERKLHLLGFYGSAAALVVLGANTGMFAVPLQVFIQSRAPDGSKGRVLATQNLLNWIGITLSAPLYFGGVALLKQMKAPECLMFAVTALLMFSVAVAYHPKSEPLAA